MPAEVSEGPGGCLGELVTSNRNVKKESAKLLYLDKSHQKGHGKDH